MSWFLSDLSWVKIQQLLRGAFFFVAFLSGNCVCAMVGEFQLALSISHLLQFGESYWEHESI